MHYVLIPNGNDAETRRQLLITDDLEAQGAEAVARYIANPPADAIASAAVVSRHFPLSHAPADALDAPPIRVTTPRRTVAASADAPISTET